jgi:hypothetical protein
MEHEGVVDCTALVLLASSGFGTRQVLTGSPARLVFCALVRWSFGTAGAHNGFVAAYMVLGCRRIGDAVATCKLRLLVYLMVGVALDQIE